MNRMTIALALTVALALLVPAAYGARSTSTIPDGSYRANVREAFLRASGIGSGDASHNSGVQTLIFSGRRWTNKTINRFHPPDCSGDLSYSGSRVTLVADRGYQCGTAAGGRLFSARWTLEHGLLRFSAIQPSDLFSRVMWGGNPWRKIG
jgi:hypothetical protein